MKGLNEADQIVSSIEARWEEEKFWNKQRKSVEVLLLGKLVKVTLVGQSFWWGLVERLKGRRTEDKNNWKS